MPLMKQNRFTAYSYAQAVQTMGSTPDLMQIFRQKPSGFLETGQFWEVK